MCRRRAPYSKAPDLTMAAQKAPSSGKHNASRRFGKGAGLLFLFLAPGGVFRGLISALPRVSMIFPLILRLTSGCVFFRSSARERPRALPLQSSPPSSAPPLFLRRPPAALIRAAPRRFGSTPHLRSGFPAPPASSPRLFPPPPPSTLPQPLPLPPPFRSFRRPCASLPVELRGSSSAPSGSRFRFQWSFR